MALRHSGRDARQPSLDGWWAASRARERARGPPHQASSIAVGPPLGEVELLAGLVDAPVADVDRHRHQACPDLGERVVGGTRVGDRGLGERRRPRPRRRRGPRGRPRTRAARVRRAASGRPRPLLVPRRACSSAAAASSRPMAARVSARSASTVAIGVPSGSAMAASASACAASRSYDEHVGGGAHRQGFGAERRRGRRASGRRGRTRWPARPWPSAGRARTAGRRGRRRARGRRRSRCTTRATR